MFPAKIVMLMKQAQNKKAYEDAVKTIDKEMSNVRVKDKRELIRERIRAKLAAKKLCYQ